MPKVGRQSVVGSDLHDHLVPAADHVSVCMTEARPSSVGDGRTLSDCSQGYRLKVQCHGDAA